MLKNLMMKILKILRFSDFKLAANVTIFSKPPSYLHRWCMWWVRTAAHWLYQDMLLWFLDFCWDEHVAAYAAGLLHRHDVNSVKSETFGDDYLASSGLQVAI